MKIALLTSDRERCGIARYSRDLCEALAPLVDVDLVPIDPWPPEGERLERLWAADVVHLQHEYSFWGTAFPPPRAYYEGLERFRRPGRLVITAHTVADAETVVTARGGGLKPLVKRWALRVRPGLRREIEAEPFALADRVIVHNPVAAGALEKRLGRPGVAQFWSMPVLEWQEPASKWGPLSQQFRFHGRRLVTIFGFVTPEKEYWLALRAILRVRREHPDATLVVAGGASDERMQRLSDGLRKMEQQFEQRVVEAERIVDVFPSSGSLTYPNPLALFPDSRVLQAEIAETAVRQLGHLLRVTGYLSDSDARAILEQTDVALLPYRSATGSYGAGAALAAGCPLVTSDLPAFAEPLPALRFRSGDVQELAESLNQVLRDDALRTHLMARSRRYAEENRWARAAERHVTLYQQLVGAAA